MKKIIPLIVFAIVIVVVNVRFVSATEIALEPTKIPEGNFSILLYKPVRSELPLRDEFAGFTIVEYSYQSYFPAFDVSYSAGFTDWTPSKEFEINKYGFPLSPISEDLANSIQGVQAMTEKRLQVNVNLLESHEIKYGNHPGRDAKLEFFSSGSRYIIRFRTYMIEYKEFWHQVVYPHQYERNARPQTFLDSFKVNSNKSVENASSSNFDVKTSKPEDKFSIGIPKNWNEKIYPTEKGTTYAYWDDIGNAITIVVREPNSFKRVLTMIKNDQLTEKQVNELEEFIKRNAPLKRQIKVGVEVISNQKALFQSYIHRQETAGHVYFIKGKEYSFIKNNMQYKISFSPAPVKTEDAAKIKFDETYKLIFYPILITFFVF